MTSVCLIFITAFYEIAVEKILFISSPTLTLIVIEKIVQYLRTLKLNERLDGTID